MRYRINKRSTGELLGVFEAPTKDLAIVRWFREMGYEAGLYAATREPHHRQAEAVRAVEEAGRDLEVTEDA